MSITSLKAARTALYTALITGTPIPNVTKVYDHEPAPGHLAKPISLTVSSGGLGVDDYIIHARLYVDVQAGVEAAQNLVDDILLAIEAKMTSSFSRIDWQGPDWDHELGMFICLGTFNVGREDGF